jgi:hypothetical protein
MAETECLEGDSNFLYVVFIVKYLWSLKIINFWAPVKEIADHYNVQENILFFFYFSSEWIVYLRLSKGNYIYSLQEIHFLSCPSCWGRNLDF